MDLQEREDGAIHSPNNKIVLCFPFLIACISPGPRLCEKWGKREPIGPSVQDANDGGEDRSGGGWARTPLPGGRQMGGSGVLVQGGGAALGRTTWGSGSGQAPSCMELPFPGTYYVLGALHGFSNLNFTEIIAHTHRTDRIKVDRCVQGAGQGAEQAGKELLVGLKEAKRQWHWPTALELELELKASSAVSKFLLFLFPLCCHLVNLRFSFPVCEMGWLGHPLAGALWDVCTQISRCHLCSPRPLAVLKLCHTPDCPGWGEEWGFSRSTLGNIFGFPFSHIPICTWPSFVPKSGSRCL